MLSSGVIDLGAYREARQYHRVLTLKHPGASFAETYRRFALLWATLTVRERAARLHRLALEARAPSRSGDPVKTGQNRRRRRGGRATIIRDAFPGN